MSRKTRSEATEIAILLPILSHPRDLKQNHVEFLDSFVRTCKRAEKWTFAFFLGLPTTTTTGVDEPSLVKQFNETLSNNNIQFTIQTLKLSQSSTNEESAWGELCELAKSNSDIEYFAMVRDDIKFKSDNWPEAIARSFSEINVAFKQPLGFGCLAFLDESFPAFATCPILHRTHFEIFGENKLFPSSITSSTNNISSLGSAFLFEIYFRFGCARILGSARIVRQPQFRTEEEAKSRSLKITQLLPQALEVCTFWLESKPDASNTKSFLGMDIVVPSFRATQAVLERIISLPKPDIFACRFIIVCDNPDSKVAIKVFHDLERDHDDDPHVRIRMNAENVGPGATRNHGLAECTGDYVIFLDDDVLPEPDVIKEYGALIPQYPTAAGFIGRTVLPPPETPRQFAIQYAGIASFWDISSKTTRDLPWGITANLCVKRSTDVTFHPEVFVKGGGGEDVDFCLRLDDYYREKFPGQARSYVPAPLATVHHPYWNNGECFLHHFFAWSKGDSTLIEVYPKRSFWTFPDFSESVLLMTIAMALLFASEYISFSTIILGLFAYGIAEGLYETICHRDLIPEWGLLFTFRVGFVTCMVRTISEMGRFYGQMDRGTLLSSMFHRYNWFEDNWPEWPRVERTRAIKRGLFRACVMGAALYVIY